MCDQMQEFFFDMIDKSGDGQITPDELLPLFTTSRDLDKGQAKCDAFFAKLDTNNDGSIDIDEWCVAVDRNPGLIAVRFLSLSSQTFNRTNCAL